MKRLLSVFLLVFFVFATTAQNKKSVERPKLVVGIVVDQMRWDYLYRYYERFGNDGFKRLLGAGFACQNTFLNYVPSYTAPGHATIYSGAIPAVHGIVGNDWIDRTTNKNRYCSQDDSVTAVGGSEAAGKMSPRQMKSNTIGDELRLATNFKSRVYGIALKDRGAIFPAGHLANAAFWFDDSTGSFMSSSYYKGNLPKWLHHFNAEKWPDFYLKENWETIYPIASYTNSIADNNNYEELKRGELLPTFPHKVVPNNYKQIRSLPVGNSLTFKLAKALIEGENLGKNDDVDLLSISLSATDYIGHAYAPNSIEVEDMYLRLDKSIAAFLKYLDAEIGAGDYLLFLTADHGGAHNAVFLKDKRMPAGILSEYDMKRELNQIAKTKFGCDSLVRAVMNYQIILNESVVEKKKIDRKALKDFLIKTCKQYPGMAYVIDIENIENSLLPSFLKQQIQNGFYESRCGSIAIIYEPAWYSDGPKGTTHGTWNPYDTHIPLLWYGWHIKQGETFERTEVIDIAATLAALLRIQMPNGASGSVIFKK